MSFFRAGKGGSAGNAIGVLTNITLIGADNDRTITVSEVDKIDSVFFKFKDFPTGAYGWASNVDNNFLSVAYGQPSHGVRSINGNQFRFTWNSAPDYQVDFYIVGEKN